MQRALERFWKAKPAEQVTKERQQAHDDYVREHGTNDVSFEERRAQQAGTYSRVVASWMLPAAKGSKK